MRVRATRDGHYGGYYRLGPIIGNTAQETFIGEVFDVDDRPCPVLDLETGKPIFEMHSNGKPVIDEKGKPKMKTKSFFSPTWMEKVSEDTPITYDYPAFEIPVQYRERKVNNAPAKGGIAPVSTSVI